MPELASTEGSRERANFEAPEGVGKAAGAVPRHCFELAANQNADLASEIRKQFRFLRYIHSGLSSRHSDKG